MSRVDDDELDSISVRFEADGNRDRVIYKKKTNCPTRSRCTLTILGHVISISTSYKLIFPGLLHVDR